MTEAYHTALVPLTQGKFAIVDFDDHARVKKHRWHAVKLATRHKIYYYAATTIDGKRVYLHRFINGTPRGFDTDHRNGRTLDNRRGNVRTSTHAQNMASRGKTSVNSTGYKGVTRPPHCRKWMASVKHRGEKIVLGWFETQEEAALAYNRAALERFGEFAVLNNLGVVPSEQPRPSPRRRLISKYKGVSRRGNRWIVRLCIGSKVIAIGSYESELEAARAYDRASKDYGHRRRKGR